MYGLPANFQPTIFEGRQLTSVTFAENVIHLNFDEELSVSVLDAVAYRNASDNDEMVDAPPLASTSLVSLVGQYVTAGRVESSRQLLLELEGGGWLRLTDNSEMYESFIITIDGKETIV
ncbi:MAG: hypothetical protein WCB04_06240 [Mycobacteriales bacterium]